MANHIIGQVLGGQKQVYEGVSYVRDVRSKLGLGSQYRASVNGSPANDDKYLQDGDYVSFSEAVKGANGRERLVVVAGYRVS